MDKTILHLGCLTELGIEKIKRIVGKTYTQYGLTLKGGSNIHSPRMLHLKGVKK
jgi:hypothetical protein